MYTNNMSKDRLSTTSRNFESDFNIDRDDGAFTPSSTTEIFVHGLHPQTTSQDLLSAFSPYCLIKDIMFKRDPLTGKHGGFAFFKVQSAGLAKKLIKAKHTILGRRIHCDIKTNTLHQQKKNQKKRVFIGGIPRSTTDDELIGLFSKFGPVRAAYSIKDSKGKPKNYGYVDFESTDSARLAVENSPIYYKGRKIDLRPYQKQNNKITREGKNNKKNRNQNNFKKDSLNTSYDNNTTSTSSSSTISHQDNYENIGNAEFYKTEEPPKYALPDFQNGVLGCFMNRQGEELQKLTQLCTLAVMNNDHLNAKAFLDRIQILKSEIFDTNYLKGLTVSKMGEF